AIEARAALLLELILLQASKDDFREVAVAIVLGRRQRDGFLEAAVAEMLGDLRGEQLRLLARLVIGVDALDRDTHRPERHDEQDDGHAPRQRAHLTEHVDEVEAAATFLRKRWRAEQEGTH